MSSQLDSKGVGVVQHKEWKSIAGDGTAFAWALRQKGSHHVERARRRWLGLSKGGKDSGQRDMVGPGRAMLVCLAKVLVSTACSMGNFF